MARYTQGQINLPNALEEQSTGLEQYLQSNDNNFGGADTQSAPTGPAAVGEGQTQSPLPVYQAPQWTNAIPENEAAQIAANPELMASIPSLQAIGNEYTAFQQQKEQASATYASEMAQYSQTGKPLVEPPGLGRAPSENTVLPGSDYKSPAIDFNTPRVDPQGNPYTTGEVAQFGNEQFNREQTQNRFDDVGGKLEDVDKWLSQREFTNDKKDRFISDIGHTSSLIVGGKTLIEPEIGKNSFLKGNSDIFAEITGITDPVHQGVVTVDAIISLSKLLAGKANAKPTEAKDAYTLFTDQGEVGLYANQKGFNGMKPADLAKGLAGDIMTRGTKAKPTAAGQTAAQKDNGYKSPPQDLQRMALGIMDELQLLDYDTHQIRDKDGNPRGEPFQAAFMNDKLFDLFKTFIDDSELFPVKVGAQSVLGTTKSGAVGEVDAHAKKNQNRAKGEAKRSNKKNIFDDWQTRYKGNYRAHDLEVLGFEGTLISLANTLDKRRINGENIAPEDPLLQYETLLERLYDIPPFPTGKIREIAQQGGNQEAVYNAVLPRKNKLDGLSKQLVSAYHLQKAMPEGHIVGAGVSFNDYNNRSSNVGYNTSEQLSPMFRGSLTGYESQTSRSKILASTNSTVPLINKNDLAKIYGVNSGPQVEEVAQILSWTRELLIVDRGSNAPRVELQYIGGRDLVDAEVIKYATPAFFAGHLAQYKKLKQKMKDALPDDQVPVLASQGPSAVTLKTEGLADFNSGEQELFNLLVESRKHHGQLLQMFDNMERYFDATPEVKQVPFKGAMIMPDMVNAGTLNTIVNSNPHLARQIMARIGFTMRESAKYPQYALTEGADGTSRSPYGNVRLFIADEVINQLELAGIKDRKMLNPGNPSGALNQFMLLMLKTPQGAALANDFAKTPHMIVGYGMAIGGAAKTADSTLQKAISTSDNINGFKPVDGVWPKESLRYKWNNIVNSNPNGETAALAMQTAVQSSLAAISNPGYTKGFQLTGIAAGMMNTAVVNQGYAGATQSITKTQRRPLFNTRATYIGSDGVARNSSAIDSDIEDAPYARADAKLLDSGDYTTPNTYSAQSQAWTPGLGQDGERALIGKSLEIYQNTYGEYLNSILDGHDQVGMTPLQSMRFQHILMNKAVPWLIRQKKPQMQAKETLDRALINARKMRDSSKVVTMGPGSDYFHITEHLDELYNSITGPVAEGFTPEVTESIKKGRTRAMRTLQSAMDRQLWSPKFDAKVGGVEFETSAKSIDGKWTARSQDLFTWWDDNYYRPAYKKLVNEVISNDAMIDAIAEDLEKVDNSTTGFFTSGRSGEDFIKNAVAYNPTPEEKGVDL